MRSASVPCGTSSACSVPLATNASAVPVRDGRVEAVNAAITFFTRPAITRSPRPLRSGSADSNPIPFEIVMSPVAFVRHSAASRFVGCPGPKPGIIIEELSWKSATASLNSNRRCLPTLA